MTPGLLVSCKTKQKLFSKKPKKPTVSNIATFKAYNNIYNTCRNKAKKYHYNEKFNNCKKRPEDNLATYQRSLMH